MLIKNLDINKINNYFNENKFIPEDLNILDERLYTVNHIMGHGFTNTNVMVLNVLIDYKINKLNITGRKKIVNWIIEIMNSIEDKEVTKDYNIFFMYDNNFDIDDENNTLEDDMYGFLYHKAFVKPTHYKITDVDFDNLTITIKDV